ncbi:MAG: threonine synthase [Alphaproteobacteria bacterium]|nr:threonine synthase [Alphaproteobacteria bacterium]
MQYVSTRGKSKPLDFEGVLLAGLADDGGLYIPSSLPFYSPEQIAALAPLSYNDLCYELIRPFIGHSIPEDDLRTIIEDAYKTFRHHLITPLTQIGHHEWVLELFHGPTLAFKDVALQLLGRLLDYVLKKRGEEVVILGATSGDTGSAAIEGCQHCTQAKIYILHPYQKVSPVQRRQMTTITGPNVHNIAIEGTFDDCQAMVKQLFLNQSFLGDKSLVAINSINWARIMAQTVYYFYSALALGAPFVSMGYSVPTGNFGDVYAGSIARRMGLPIHQLVVATNVNDILYRFFEMNDYSRQTLKHTLTPSMDIQVSSNFERLLFDIHDRNPDAVRHLMDVFAENGTLRVEPNRLAEAKAQFDAWTVSESEVLQTMRDVYHDMGLVLDPHTAVGVASARHCRRDPVSPMITLATAHPIKFAEAVKMGSLPVSPLPDFLSDLMEREERYTVLPNSIDAVKSFIASSHHR